MPPPVFRFAPSPNGYLHLGHAYSALLNFDLARESGGRVLLRIEDIDATRCKPEFEAAITEDLARLGTTWEAPARRQSVQSPRYPIPAAVTGHPLSARIMRVTRRVFPPNGSGRPQGNPGPAAAFCLPGGCDQLPTAQGLTGT